MLITKKSKYPPQIKNQGGEIIQELLGLKAGSVSSHSIAEITLPPGKTVVPHFHKETEETYLILSGLASMQIDGIQFDLQAGETVLIEPKEVHQITNHSENNLVFLAVCVPAWHPGDSFEFNASDL